MTIVCRAAVPPRLWDETVARLGGWWFHTTHWLDYALAYTPGAVDRSALCWRDGDVPVWLAAVVQAPDGTSVLGGRPSVSPLLGAVLRDDESAALEALVPHGTQTIERPTPTVEREPDWPTAVIDLTQPSAIRWTRVRRSAHALIHRAQREYGLTTEWTPPAALAAVAACEALHMETAGRRTRPTETWRLMGAWLRDGQAVLATASKPADAGLSGLRAYAYAIVWRQWAYYASGASLDPDVSHALIWALGEALAAREVPHFEVGWGARVGDDRKARAIAFFKAGCGGDVWEVPTTTWHWLTEAVATPMSTRLRGAGG